MLYLAIENDKKKLQEERDLGANVVYITFWEISHGTSLPNWLFGVQVYENLRK